MTFEVYVTSDEVPKAALDVLRSVSHVRVNGVPGTLAREALLKEVRGADGVLCLLSDKMDGEVLSRASRLRVISVMAVGYDNVDLGEATRRGVMVTNTPDVLTETVADFTVALLLAIARRIVEADRYVREGGWTVSWTPMQMVGADVHGKTLGIYGLGRIGQAVARRARGFGLRTLYFSRSRNPRAERELGLEFVPMKELLARSDFITVHVPLTAETRHSIGVKEIAQMKRGAFLVNTSRGAVVDEGALRAALQRGRIAGAALDVFEKEPIGRDDPLTRRPNVVLLPHVGSATVETRTAMAVLAARNIVAALRGGTPPNLVNRVTGDRRRRARRRAPARLSRARS